MWFGTMIVLIAFLLTPTIVGTIDILKHVPEDINFSFRIGMQGFINAIFQGFVVIIALTFVQVPIIAVLVMEKELHHNIKEMQLLIGVKVKLYYLANWCVDQFYFLIFGSFAILCSTVFYSNKKPTCLPSFYYHVECIDGYPMFYDGLGKDNDNITLESPALLSSHCILIFVYCFTLTPWVYAGVVNCKDHSKAIISAVVMGFVFGIGLPLIFLTFTKLNIYIPHFITSPELASILDIIFNIFPQYALVTGLVYPKMKYFTSKAFNLDGMGYLDRGCDADFEDYLYRGKGVTGIDFLYCRSWEQDLIFRCVYMLV
eukprot:Pgem_evm1s6493